MHGYTAFDLSLNYNYFLPDSKPSLLPRISLCLYGILGHWELTSGRLGLSYKIYPLTSPKKQTLDCNLASGNNWWVHKTKYMLNRTLTFVFILFLLFADLNLLFLAHRMTQASRFKWMEREEHGRKGKSEGRGNQGLREHWQLSVQWLVQCCS